jgi:hypothetical protein
MKLSQISSVIRRTAAASAAAVVGFTAISFGFGSTAMAGTPSEPDSFGAYYIVTPANGVVSASTTFTVPTLNCSSGAIAGQAYGIEADFSNSWSSGTVARSKVNALCNGTVPQYQFDVFAGSTEFVKNGVSAGDVVVASYYQTSAVVQATVHDITSGYTWVADGAPTGSTYVVIGATVFYNSTIETYTHFAPASTSAFTQAEVNGDYIGYQSPMEWRYRASGISVTASAGTLRSNGDNFKLSTKVV